jgi:hypothetical protein
LGIMLREIRSEKFRQQLLKIYDAKPYLGDFVQKLNCMRHGPAIAEWLIHRGLTGDSLISWMREKQGNSFLESMKTIAAEIERAPKRPVLVGRDYIPPGAI